MTNSGRGSKNRKYQAIRRRYQEKRHSRKWKTRKANKKEAQKQIDASILKYKASPYVEHIAPTNFSFTKNTEEVLKYFNKTQKTFHSGKNVTFNLSEVETMTSDTIALLIASIKSVKFAKRGNSRGNQPQKPELQKMFSESGFYDQVTQSGFPSLKSGNLLHREVHKRVEPNIAKEACKIGLRHVYGQAKPFHPLYEILIECMSNTHNHATLYEQGECKWWLYVCKHPNENKVSYTFVDLGIGIFKSAHMTGMIKKFLKGTAAIPHVDLVDDLLAGNIQSRIEKDRGIRGKGIPQIAEHASLPCFSEFYIITNDVKIDLKENKKVQLPSNYSGTLLHWSLTTT
tara:strand:- start:14701 stop:15729 length:1029 start_codon:yes stop_codon:yes gene_type:complete